MKIGAICLIREEQPEHSPYSIRTVVEQLRPIENMQMIIIANGCKVSDSLRHYIDQLPNVLLLELSMNVGIPIAWNMAFDLLSSDYYLMLSDDIRVEPVVIQKFIETLENRSSKVAVVGVEGVICQGVGEDGLPETYKRYQKKKKKFLRPVKKAREIIEVTNVSGFLFAISGDFIRETRFRYDTQYSPAFFEEFELSFFARQNGYKLVIVNGLSQYYDHSWGVSKRGGDIKYLDSTIDTQDLVTRNTVLFKNKWGGCMLELLVP